LFRAAALVHCFENKGRRGYYKVYTRKKKNLLYVNGKKDYNYYVVKTYFNGNFFGKFSLGEDKEKEYRKKKMLALESREHQTKNQKYDKYVEDRQKLFQILATEKGMSIRKMTEYLNDKGMRISRETVTRLLNEFKAVKKARPLEDG